MSKTTGGPSTRTGIAWPTGFGDGGSPAPVGARPAHAATIGMAALILAAACETGPGSETVAGASLGSDTAVVLHSRAPAANAFREAVRAAMPGLVFVQVEGMPTGLRGWPGLRPDASPFDRDDRQPVPVGSGSGFVLDSTGLIVTNNHLVREAVAVTVVLRDNRRLDATVVGRDPDTDIAVLRVEADGLTAANLGNSDSVQVGDWVLALGYPLGLSSTVTAGIVSGIGRSLGMTADAAETVAPLEHFIQTDAAINPGNSGGPMVDLAGRVVGVNTAIASPTGYYTGYGFAVPINLARRVAEDLIRFGEVRRPALGVRIADVTPADAQVFGVPAIAGAVVVGLIAGGPAVGAGIEPGDVIVGVDADSIASAGDLQSVLARKRPGDRVGLRVIRYGDPVAVALELATLPRPAPRTGQPPAFHTGPPRPGFTVVQDGGGVVVAEIDRFSSAARAGVRPGQRIIAVNRRPVRTVQDVRAGMDEVRPPSPLSLRVVDPALGETIINLYPAPRHRGQ